MACQSGRQTLLPVPSTGQRKIIYPRPSLAISAALANMVMVPHVGHEGRFSVRLIWLMLYRMGFFLKQGTKKRHTRSQVRRLFSLYPRTARAAMAADLPSAFQIGGRNP